MLAGTRRRGRRSSLCASRRATPECATSQASDPAGSGQKELGAAAVEAQRVIAPAEGARNRIHDPAGDADEAVLGAVRELRAGSRVQAEALRAIDGGHQRDAERRRAGEAGAAAAGSRHQIQAGHVKATLGQREHQPLQVIDPIAPPL